MTKGASIVMRRDILVFEDFGSRLLEKSISEHRVKAKWRRDLQQDEYCYRNNSDMDS